MPHSSRGSFSGRRPGTVTVIEEPVRRSAARKAKIVACCVWVLVTLLAAAVLASRWHPILALLAGALIGLAAAFITATAVLIWPVARTLWWWAPEIGLAVALTTGWIWLADHATLPARIAVTTAIIAVPAAIPPARRVVIAACWCLITRRRLRTCFAQFIITNRLGTLPHILLARPTPAGERIWLWLRPGIALDDIQARADLIAVACWASTAVAEAASTTNAALVRIDVKRRDTLTGKVASPLLGHVIPALTGNTPDPAAAPAALDLPDVTASQVQPPVTRPARADKKTAPADDPVVLSAAGDDITDWL